MSFVLSLHKITKKDRPRVGGKGFSLSIMARRGMNVPDALCISTGAYQEYVRSTGLRDIIFMELGRKSFEEMRWEEIWDTALRIRNFFLKTPIPPDLCKALMDAVNSAFGERAVSVRSSAPGEDSSKTSFAGLHESYLNIRGGETILDHVRLVWASLWSDRALLYRKELGLDAVKSAMAVVVQEMVAGERSGVIFGKSPVDESQAVIEAIHGLNQGLVDGTVEPDRWLLDRKTGNIVSHIATPRDKILSPSPQGVRLKPLPTELKNKPPLEMKEVNEVFDLVMKAETLFGTPQDVEWTYRRDLLHTLQARPITTLSASDDDQRPWYLSLHRSFDNLKSLRLKIENEIVPAMEEEASRLALKDLSELTDAGLADEIEQRMGVLERWLTVYREDCIPFAHGMRLFGQVYNDVMQPKDPFEFMDLLVGADMVSKRRNQKLQHLASLIRKDPKLAACLRQRKLEDCDPEFRETLHDVSERFGDLTWGSKRFSKDINQLVTFLLEMATRLPADGPSQNTQNRNLEERFLSRFKGDRRIFAVEMLDIARASYRLRDDDNTYLGKIEGQLALATDEGKRRIRRQGAMKVNTIRAEHLVKTLRNNLAFEEERDMPLEEPKDKDFQLKPRQLVGQPAGPGLAFGRARVVTTSSDLFQFKSGEILVCDAVDPNMTFVVPLATGIVERRGGMLIHGAIIAREYGLPCVTGVPDAISLIHTGDQVTVDGFLGIVTVGESRLKDTKNANAH